MMNKTKLFLQTAIVLAALAIPAAASAQSGAVHDALRGSVFDPYASTISVVPPRGGAVMVYRHGKVTGWYLQPGIATVRPGQVYGVLATRGTRMVFNAGILIRPGATELVWSDGDLPRIAYAPAYHHRPHYVATRPGHGAGHGAGHKAATPHQGTSTPRNSATKVTRSKLSAKKPSSSVITRGQYRGLLRGLNRSPRDTTRFAVLKRYAKRYQFKQGQASTVVRKFETRRYRRSAARLLKRSTVSSKTVSSKPVSPKAVSTKTVQRKATMRRVASTRHVTRLRSR
jgi:hypothetical protein